LRPDHYEGFSNLAGVLFGNGRLEEAERLLLQSLRLEPTNAAGHFTLANLYFTLVPSPHPVPHSAGKI
jgi:hypothetical protein